MKKKSLVSAEKKLLVARYKKTRAHGGEQVVSDIAVPVCMM